MRKILLVFILVLFSVSCSKDETAPLNFTLHEPNLTAEEDYKIYSLLLNNYGYNYVIVQQSTQYGSIFQSENNYHVQNLIDNNPGFEIEMAQNHIDINQTSAYLGNYFNCPTLTIRLSPEEELAYIFSGEDVDKNWVLFYRYFKNPYGLYSFSKISYNSNATKAVVEMSIYQGSIVAQGTLIYLEKENDNWVIKDVIETWVS